MQDMCDYIDCALKNIYKRCSMYEFNIEIWGNFFDFCIARRKPQIRNRPHKMTQRSKR